MAKYKLQKWVLNGLTRYRDRQSDGGIRQSSGRNDSRLIQSPGVQLPTGRERQSERERIRRGACEREGRGSDRKQRNNPRELRGEGGRAPLQNIISLPAADNSPAPHPKSEQHAFYDQLRANAAIIGKVAVVVPRGHFSFVEERHGRSKGCGYWIVLRLADVHPSVEKGSVRIWPFCRHSPLFNVSSCRLSSSRRRHWNWKQIRRSAERKEEFCTRQISLCGILALSLSPRTGARGRQTAEEHVVHRRTAPDERTEWRGKSDSYGGLLSPSPSVNPSLPFWVTGRASCNRRRLCSAFHAPPDIERLSIVGHLVMTGRSWSHHTSTLDRLTLPSRLLPNRRRRRFFGQQVRARCPEARWSE